MDGAACFSLEVPSAYVVCSDLLIGIPGEPILVQENFLIFNGAAPCDPGERLQPASTTEMDGSVLPRSLVCGVGLPVDAFHALLG